MNPAARGGAALALILLGVAVAQGQEGAPAPPAGDAVIRVHLVHDTRPAGVAGAEVILYSLTPKGDPGLRRARADAEGRTRFEGLSNDPEVVYLVGTRIAGVPFGTRFAFERDEREREVEIAVSDPSLDGSDVTSDSTLLRLERGCDDLRVHHTHGLQNRGASVVYVPPGQRAGAKPLLELLLPEAATAIETPLGGGEDGYEREGRRLRFWGPLYPGRQEIEFGYGMPLAAETVLEVAFPDGAQEIAVLTAEGDLQAMGEGLRPDGEQPLATGLHTVQRAPDLEAGGVLRLRVSADPVAASGPQIELVESRLWLELDDAALEVSEQHQLRAAGEGLAATHAPALCLNLPDGASDVRFGSASLDLGLSRDPSGAVAIRGPLPPGESSLSLRYRLPVGDGPFTFQRRFAAEVELLSVLVEDTGILPSSPRLHLRRPVRTEDSAYLHLEAFAVSPDEVVELRLEPLPRPGSPSRIASTGFVLAVALASLLFLAAPLRTETADGEHAAPESPATIERQAVYEAIEALDEDFETGKLSSGDHARMRDELRNRAVWLLQSERDAAAARVATVAAPAPFCTSCGTRSRSGDRFCAHCGNAFSAEPPTT